MPAAYEIRSQGDVKNKKQSMADLKLRRLNELNSRLREDLDRPRIKVSEASMSYVMSGNINFWEHLLTMPRLQTDTILHKHKGFHGAVDVGLGKLAISSDEDV